MSIITKELKMKGCMNTEIVLPKRIRIFTLESAAFPKRLKRSGNHFKPGKKVLIGEPREMLYDNQPILVVSVVWGKVPHFLVVNEIGKLNLRKRE
jgi:hypothetical protein